MKLNSKDQKSMQSEQRSMSYDIVESRVSAATWTKSTSDKQNSDSADSINNHIIII